MMRFLKLPSTRELRRRFIYEPEAGLLRWKQKSRGRKQGAVAGSISKYGYRIVPLAGGKHARAARVIWKMQTGHDPGFAEIDHKNRKRDDDRWCNLRLAERWQQTVNSWCPRNTSGYRGVYQRPSGRWCVQIRARKKTQLLGTYDTREEAAAVYARAARELDAEFGRDWGDAKHTWQEAEAA